MHGSAYQSHSAIIHQRTQRDPVCMRVLTHAQPICLLSSSALSTAQRAYCGCGTHTATDLHSSLHRGGRHVHLSATGSVFDATPGTDWRDHRAADAWDRRIVRILPTHPLLLAVPIFPVHPQVEPHRPLTSVLLHWAAGCRGGANCTARGSPPAASPQLLNSYLQCVSKTSPN